MSDPRVNSAFAEFAGEFTEGGTFSSGTATPIDDPDIGTPNQYNYPFPPLLVYVETATDSGVFDLQEFLACAQITRSIDGGDSTCLLRTEISADDLSSPRPRSLATVLVDLNPGRRVRVAIPAGASGERILFQGFCQTHTLRFDEGVDSLTATCISEGQEALRHHPAAMILERLQRKYPLAAWNPETPDAVKITALTAIFNEGGKPNRLREMLPVTIGEDTFRLALFGEGNAIDVTLWRYVDALRYVCGWYVARKPTLNATVSVVEFLHDTESMIGAEIGDNDPLARRLLAPIAELAIASTSVDEAIHLICAAAGVHHETTLRQMQPGDGTSVASFVLRVFAVLANDAEQQATPSRRMGEPKRMNLPREAAFFDPTSPLRSARDIASANKAQQNDLTLDRRTVGIPTYLGGVPEFEVFLILRPGWEPHPNLDNLTSVEAQDDAIGYWEEQFEAEYAVDEDGHPTAIPVSLYHGKHPQHDSAFYTNISGSLGRVRDALRRWIFPDDVSYLDGAIGVSRLARNDWPAKWYSPYDPLDGFDDPRNVLASIIYGGAIGGAAGWIARRRPFRETIGRRDAQGNRNPIVYVHYDAPNKEAIPANGWVEFAGAARIDEERASIVITENKLLGSAALQIDESGKDAEDSALYAYIHGTFAVGICCTIVGDERMFHAPAGPLTGRAMVHDWGFDKFKNRNRFGQNSPLNAQGPDPDPEYNDRDDTVAMQRASDLDAGLKILETIAGTVVVPWIDTRIRPGDSFSGVEGLGLAFGTSPGVVAITTINDPQGGPRTELQLSDFRQAPEVGVEV